MLYVSLITYVKIQVSGQICPKSIPFALLSINSGLISEKYLLFDLLLRFIFYIYSKFPGLPVFYALSENCWSISQTLDGVNRVSVIVKAMKALSHPDQWQMENADLNRAIQDTLVISRNEYKYVAEVETDLDPGLPFVPCYLSALNQVFLNVIVNAAHAIRDANGNGSEKRGRITVKTRREGNEAVIRISDTGAGIPEKIRHRIFEPFFTTKGVGKGTGQGLSIAHSVVTQKHGGTITFETEAGKGTTFIVRLPLGHRES